MSSNGLPGFRVVGLPDASCRESRDRVRAAIISSGLRWPQKRVTVNLAPSGCERRAQAWTSLSALGVLAADGQFPARALEGLAFVGGARARRVVPPSTGHPPSGRLPLASRICRGATRCAPRSLARPAGHRARAVEPEGPCRGPRGARGWPELPPAVTGVRGSHAVPDLADVRGQAFGRQALEVAAAGGHHLLMVGPAGSGKTMLAPGCRGSCPRSRPMRLWRLRRSTRLPGIELASGGLSLRPPFRSPHHSASAVSLIGGGGARIRPGEISCANLGVLFLDELAEFPAPCSTTSANRLKKVVSSCAGRAQRWPSRHGFMLVAAMNACRCGADGSPGSCTCTPASRARYAGRISGPLLDRFDLRIRVHRPAVEDLLASGARRLASGAGTEPTCQVAARVSERARKGAGAGCEGERRPAVVAAGRGGEPEQRRPAAARAKAAGRATFCAGPGQG